MKNKLYNAIREMILAEINEDKQGRISNNFVIANADKANRLKELFASSDTHKWISDIIEIIMEAGETGVDRKNLVDKLKEINANYKLSTLNDETRSLIKSGVLSLGGLSRPKKVKAPSTGKKGRPAKTTEQPSEEALDESLIRMQKLAGII